MYLSPFVYIIRRLVGSRRNEFWYHIICESKRIKAIRYLHKLLNFGNLIHREFEDKQKVITSLPQNLHRHVAYMPIEYRILPPHVSKSSQRRCQAELLDESEEEEEEQLKC